MSNTPDLFPGRSGNLATIRIRCIKFRFWLWLIALCQLPVGASLLIYTSRFMDYLWTPWRYAYITGAKEGQGCVFCDKQNEPDDRKSWIVHRGDSCYICLNTFPYTSGHVMVIPYEHIDELQKLPPGSAREMIDLSQRTETVLRSLYHPDGINLGMNIGAAAGAGIAGHIHMHVLPRWVADANFMTVVGETRVLPESLETTWERMSKAFVDRTL